MYEVVESIVRCFVMYQIPRLLKLWWKLGSECSILGRLCEV